MRNFFKENWFKAGLLVLASVSILFYVFSWQPSQKKKEQLANNIRCQEDGTHLLERIKKELSSKESYDKAEFRFVLELNTCLFNGARTARGNNDSTYFYSHFIKDVYTNMDLARYDTFVNDDGQGSDFGEVEEYNLLEIKYFSE